MPSSQTIYHLFCQATVQMYADDSTLYYAAKTVSKLDSVLNAVTRVLLHDLPSISHSVVSISLYNKAKNK